MQASPRSSWLFVGGYGPAIETFRFDPQTGLSPAGMTQGVPESPTFLALDAPRRLLFAISEAAGADAPRPGRATSFRIEPSGALSRLNDVWSGGGNTVSVAVSRSGRHLLTASSSTAEGRVAVIPIGEDGRLAEPSDSQIAGRNAHGQAQSVDGCFVYVACRGDEHVAQYAFDAGAGKLRALAVPSVAVPRPSGPRRIVVHPTLPVAYLILDWSGEVVTYQIGGDGQLHAAVTTSIFPAGKAPRAQAGVMTAADLEVSADGKTLYASTRTPDCQSIAVLRIDARGGLTLLANEHADGLIHGPRHFVLSPDNRFLFVANQDSDTLLAMTVQPETGRLALLGRPVPTRVSKPNALAFGALSPT